MRTVRNRLLGATYEQSVQDIEKAFECSRRTAERIYAGQPVSAPVTLAILLHPDFGGPYLEALLQGLPAERRAVLARRLIESADLIRMEAEQEQLAQRLAEKRAERRNS